MRRFNEHSVSQIQLRLNSISSNTLYWFNNIKAIKLARNSKCSVVFSFNNLGILKIKGKISVVLLIGKATVTLNNIYIK